MAEAQRTGNSPPDPEAVCRIDDHALGEASGLVAGDGRWYAVNDGGAALRIYALDRHCAVTDVITDPADPYDVEDLARSADGTFWLADIGDNRSARDTVALHALRPGEGSTLYRLTYPDGARDAEAVLIDREGAPYIVTKSATGTSGVYRPAGALRSPGPTPLEQVGTVTVSPTTTPGGPVGTAGTWLITGGATSHDGRVVALRTYTDAYLYPAPDGDIVAALEREPVRVPLPGEPQGEAIAFQPDGTLVSVSEGVGNPVRIVPDAASLVAGPGEAGSEHDGAGSDTSADGGAAGDGAQGHGRPTGPDDGRQADRAPAGDARRDDDGSGFPVVPVGAGAAVIGLLGAALVVIRRRRP
nr:WYL domain-containing protein [Prauserella alba]